MESAAGPETVGVVAASVIFGAFVLKLVDFVKYLIQGFRGDWNGFLTLGLTWRRDYLAAGDARKGNSFQLRLAFRNIGI